MATRRAGDLHRRPLAPERRMHSRSRQHPAIRTREELLPHPPDRSARRCLPQPEPHDRAKDHHRSRVVAVHDGIAVVIATGVTSIEFKNSTRAPVTDRTP